jgi:hypothetical protein
MYSYEILFTTQKVHLVSFLKSKIHCLPSAILGALSKQAFSLREKQNFAK